MPYTEQQIRGLAINFLRFHYKLRPRYLGGGTRVVDKPHYYQGVLIDARLAYQQPDRTFFTATIEATSIDRSEEILYRVNYWRITVHALVWSLVLFAAFAWAGPLVWGTNLWKLYGSPRVYLVLVSTFLALVTALGALLSRARRYRYIYAVDQFKHFYADAQWVAYDVAIFANGGWRMRRRYRELARQCVKYGFGMLAVDADQVVRNVISPSQVDQFGGLRSHLPRWLARGEITKPRFRQGELPPPELADPLAREAPAERALVPARPGRPRPFAQPRRRLALLRARMRRQYRSLYPSTLRRKPGYFTLGWWVFLVGLPALGLLGYGLYRQASYAPYAREGRKYAEPDLGMLESPANPPPPLEIESGEYQRTPDTGLVVAAPPVGLPPEALVTEGRVEDLNLLRRYTIDTAGRVVIDYDCVPLYQIREPVFLLLFGRYHSFETARQWALELNRLYGSAVTVARGECVEPASADYLLYLGAPTTEEGEANFLARSFIGQSGLEVEIIEIK